MIAFLDRSKKDESTLATRLAHIESLLSDIQNDKNYGPIFNSNDAPLPIVQRTFVAAQKAAHDAYVGVSNGEPLNPASADIFHNELQEFLINLQAMPPNSTFGQTQIPKDKVVKKLMNDVNGVVRYANDTPGFEEVSVLRITERSTAQETVTYARRSLAEIDSLLNHRTMTNVTSQGVEAARSLQLALNNARGAIERMVDENGNRVTQMDANGSPLSDQLEPFKEAMKEARIQANFYEKLYKPNVWADAHRQRAGTVVRRLDERTGFAAKVLAVREMQVIAPQDHQKQSPDERVRKKPNDDSKIILDPSQFPDFAVQDLGETRVAPEGVQNMPLRASKIRAK